MANIDSLTIHSFFSTVYLCFECGREGYNQNKNHNISGFCGNKQGYLNKLINDLFDLIDYALNAHYE